MKQENGAQRIRRSFAARFWCWLWHRRIVRDPSKVGSIKHIWAGEYPTRNGRYQLSMGGPLTLLEKVVSTLLLWRTYIDWGYGARKTIIPEQWDTAFIEWYVLGRSMVLFLFLCLDLRPSLDVAIGIIVGWEIIGLIALPLRIVLVDRYAPGWKPHSYNRSLILLFWNYFEMIIGFAYMYLHFGLVRQSDCANPITTVREALYFSLVTITTLGYGDMHPVGWGRFFAFWEPIMGIVLLVLVVGLFFIELGRQRQR